jgi:hypothetical protein
MTFDTVFSTAVRNELEVAVETPVRRSRRVLFGIGGLVVASLLVAGGGAVAGKWFVPGSDVITPLSDWQEITGDGSATVDLGARADGSNSVRGSLTCLSAGHFEIQTKATEFSSFDCDAASVPFGTNNNLVINLEPGSHSAVITATGKWSLKYRYSDRQVTEWAVNDNGQTYGTPNDNGFPDLQSVYATNGKIGYVYTEEFSKQGIPPEQPADVDTDEEILAWNLEICGFYYPAIPVYKADGVTVVGEFGGSVNNGPQRYSPDGVTWYDC